MLFLYLNILTRKMTGRFVIRVMNLAEDTNEDKLEQQLNDQGLRSKPDIQVVYVQVMRS